MKDNHKMPVLSYFDYDELLQLAHQQIMGFSTGNYEWHIPERFKVAITKDFTRTTASLSFPNTLYGFPIVWTEGDKLDLVRHK